jgi:hypothetical protein
MSTVGNLLGNLGQADSASNFILEQKSLGRILAQENRIIRDIINENVSYYLSLIHLFDKIDG